MTPALFLLVAVAGGLGAVARFALDLAVRRTSSPDFPLATLIINVTGSLTLGIVIGLALGGVVTDGVRTVLASGFLAGYTTFSAASVETVRLLQDRRTAAAALYSLGSLVLGTVAAAAGLLFATLF